MLTLTALYLCLLSAAIVALMFRQHVRGTHDLLSARNLALLGFIIFQLTSAAAPLFVGRFRDFHIADPVATAVRFGGMATVFVIVFLLVYDRGWIAKSIARRIPATRYEPNDGTLLLMAFILTFVALCLCLGVQIPLIGTIANYLGTGLAAIACGLVGWVWGRRLLNPMLIAFGVFIVAMNLGNMMMGAFGRRGLVAVGAGLVWGMYYSEWRYIATGPMLRRMALVSLPPVIFLALFTSVRSSGEHERTTAQHLQAISTGGNVKEGLYLLFEGQNTGTISMWLTEAYPAQYSYRYFMTIRYFFAVAVPRDWWPEKPMPLSTLIAGQARVQGMDWDRVKLSPGIIGSAAAEGGWLALVVYAAIGGLFIRFFDEAVTSHPASPFVVLPMGSALGQILGLPRGETSVFANILVITVVSSYVCMIVLGKFIDASGLSRRFAIEDDEPTYSADESDETADDHESGTGDHEDEGSTDGAEGWRMDPAT